MCRVMKVLLTKALTVLSLISYNNRKLKVGLQVIILYDKLSYYVTSYYTM